MAEPGDISNISDERPYSSGDRLSLAPGFGTDLAEAEKQAAKDWGVGSPQYRWHLAFAAHRCPDCGGPLVRQPDSSFRCCEKCRLKWFAQFSERDGSAKPGSMIACFRFD